MTLQTNISNKGGLVDRYINTSYDIVVFVANNMDAITSVYSSINSGQLTTIETAINSGDITAAIAAAVTTASDAAAVAADRAAVEATYDLFDDRMLGALASDPTLDNDGNPLVAGTMYFNTTLGRMQFYSGSGWVDFNTGVGLGLSDSATSTILRVSDNGIGVESFTPYAWGTTYTGVQIGGRGTIGTVTNPLSAGAISVSENAYLGAGGWTYIKTAGATQIQQGNGNISFKTASSGTEETAITFRTPLTITNDGNVYGFGPGDLVGNTAFGLGIFDTTVSGISNTAFGYNAADALTTGYDNIFMGRSAGAAITTGHSNVIMGTYAADGITSASANFTANNTIIGANAFTAGASDGYNNIIIGANAAYQTTGSLNNSIIIGYLAASGTPSGSPGRFIAIGYEAGKNALVTGTNDNIFMGYQSGGVGGPTSACVRNIGIGSFSLEDIIGGDSNIGIGTAAGRNITSGTDNVVIGGQTAGDGMTTASANIVIGSGALSGSGNPLGAIAIGYQTLANASADGNVAIGYGAGITMGSNGGSTFIGYQAGYEGTGANNTYIGYEAGVGGFGTASVSNVGIGYRALYSNDSTGAFGFNVAVGYRAGNAITSGSSNVFIGNDAGLGLTTETYCVAIGDRSMADDSGVGTNNQNTAIGADSLRYIDSANYNVAIGYGALKGSVTTDMSGNRNIAIGFTAGWGITTGENNTCIGTDAGKTITTGTNTTVLGYSAEPSAATANNEITLGNTSIATLRCQVALTVLSDERDKTNIQNSVLGLDFVSQLSPVTYQNSPRNGELDTTSRIGLIAQDVRDVAEALGINFPGLKSYRDGEQLELTYQDFIPPMINAIKELKAQVEALQP